MNVKRIKLGDNLWSWFWTPNKKMQIVVYYKHQNMKMYVYGVYMICILTQVK